MRACAYACTIMKACRGAHVIIRMYGCCMRACGHTGICLPQPFPGPRFRRADRSFGATFGAMPDVHVSTTDLEGIIQFLAGLIRMFEVLHHFLCTEGRVVANRARAASSSADPPPPPAEGSASSSADPPLPPPPLGGVRFFQPRTPSPPPPQPRPGPPYRPRTPSRSPQAPRPGPPYPPRTPSASPPPTVRRRSRSRGAR